MKKRSFLFLLFGFFFIFLDKHGVMLNNNKKIIYKKKFSIIWILEEEDL